MLVTVVYSSIKVHETRTLVGADMCLASAGVVRVPEKPLYVGDIMFYARTKEAKVLLDRRGGWGRSGWGRTKHARRKKHFVQILFTHNLQKMLSLTDHKPFGPN